MGRSLSLVPSIRLGGRRFPIRLFGNFLPRRVDRPGGNIRDAPCNDLPCEKPCPPPSSTTDALRKVVLNWLGESACPSGVVFCTPSKEMEAWVVAALWLDNSLVQRNDWECRSNPEGQLSTVPKGQRIRKRPEDYERKQKEIEKAWPCVAARLTEAARFEREFLAAIP